MADKRRLTKQDLTTLIDNELRQSYGYGDGKLEQDRRRNLYFFQATPKEELAPPSIEGRSKVVDTTVRNTVLGMEGPLLKTFYGSDNVFEFEETREEDAPKAKLISEYVNHILRKKNPGYSIISTWIREALLIRKGIIKVWWDDSDVETREEYNGQTIEQVTMLLDDPEVEIVEQKSYEDEEAARQKQKMLEQAAQQLTQMAQGDPNVYAQAAAQFQQMQQQPVPMLYDVVLKRVETGGRICIENVPPEEFLISKRAKCIAESPFTAHRFQRTVAELKQAGYTLTDDLSSDESNAELSQERIERLEFCDDDAGNDWDDSVSIDPSMRRVWVVESYVQVDMDGDGIPEWRKVVKCGAQILEDVEFDGPPFVDLGSIPLPHLFYGTCPADLAIESQKIKTSLLRSALDNQYLQVNGRYFAVKNQVNLDDLLNSRPGGVVRVDNPNAVGRLDQGNGDVAGTMQMMEWAEQFAEETTGWTRNTQGGNGNQLQQTATQANIITNRADSRVESISRYMAETGFQMLGEMILKLICKYQRKSEMVKIGGAWQNVDPREWTNKFSLTINVGLGTGNKDQLVNHLMMLGQKQVEALQIGYATPENTYKLSTRLANALGFKNGDEFFTDPKQMPPKQPQQDPAIVKAQLDDQAHQRDTQLKAQQQQMDAQLAQEKSQLEAQQKQFEAQVRAQAQMETDRVRAEAETRMHEMKLSYQAQFDAMKESNRAAEREREMAFEQWKIERQLDNQVVVAEINARQKSEALSAAQNEANKDVANDGDD